MRIRIGNQVHIRRKFNNAQQAQLKKYHQDPVPIKPGSDRKSLGTDKTVKDQQWRHDTVYAKPEAKRSAKHEHYIELTLGQAERQA
ncbi:MAG: hypothetical protein HWE20_14750 [Gammaproteobacteria bacterium]|nr:hypothetical protein [Gammaproteobacteria bacterium]